MPILVAHLPPQHLAHHADRQRLNERDRLGPLEPAEPLLDERDQVLLADLRAAAQLHFGVHGFAPLLVRHPHGSRHRHRRVRIECRFHLDGIDVEAARDDHVLLAVHQVDVAFFVDIAEVSRLPESVLELGGSCLRVLVVAGNHAAAARPDLADRARCRVVAVVVDDPDLDVRLEPASRA
ncbi:hypothetical protein D9M69_531700 [compost metagenome]